MLNSEKLNILLLTSHYSGPGHRKTDVHFLSEAWAASGHNVSFITIGQSKLKQILKSGRKNILPTATIEGYLSHNHTELYHPPSTRSQIGDALTKPLTVGYGNYLDRTLKLAAEDADVVFIESGYGLCYFKRLKSVAPNAIFVALVNDRLDVVGFRKEIVSLEKELLPSFDLVRVPAERLLAELPKDANGIYVPHGLDKAAFDAERPSPYAPGSINFVSVGDMLFDPEAIERIAGAAPHATLHVFGAPFQKKVKNVKVYPETAFEEIIPYVTHADIGIAPYRVTLESGYLIQSSMKMLQYTYARLPVLAPASLKVLRPNVFGYDLGDDTELADLIRRALEFDRRKLDTDDILEWSELSEQILEIAQGARYRAGVEAIKVG
jgi:2-beta-glucuronyltransferase